MVSVFSALLICRFLKEYKKTENDKKFQNQYRELCPTGQSASHLFHISKVSYALHKVASGALSRITNGAVASTTVGTIRKRKGNRFITNNRIS